MELKPCQAMCLYHFVSKITATLSVHTKNPNLTLPGWHALVIVVLLVIFQLRYASPLWPGEATPGHLWPGEATQPLSCYASERSIMFLIAVLGVPVRHFVQFSASMFGTGDGS